VADLDLFGNEVVQPAKSAPDRPPINDMDLVEAVLAVAASTGYRLVGPGQKVYRCSETRKDGIEPVPSYEDVAVHQLIDARWLDVGGNHPCVYGRFEGYGQSILVPRRTKEAMARWRAYKRPTNWGPSGHASHAAG
jgi:hypothetical protein